VDVWLPKCWILTQPIAGAFKLKGIASKKKIVIKPVDALKRTYTGDPAPRTAQKAERREENNQPAPKGFFLRHP
jgi:hypothetical protein